MADDAAAPDGELKKSAAPTEDASDPDESEVVAAESDDGTEPAVEAESEDTVSDDAAEDTARQPVSHLTVALIAGIVGVVALAALTGWLGFRTYESHQAEQQRNVFLQVGRQGALNLTTIDWENADADVQRILDSATGTFYDDFQQRAEPFVQVVKQAQSKSVGTIAEAGLESASEDQAQVLVAVTVQTTNAGAPEQQPRAWRMRISVQEIDGEAKVSKVEFVP